MPKVLSIRELFDLGEAVTADQLYETFVDYASPVASIDPPTFVKLLERAKPGKTHLEHMRNMALRAYQRQVKANFPVCAAEWATIHAEICTKLL